MGDEVRPVTPDNAVGVAANPKLADGRVELRCARCRGSLLPSHKVLVCSECSASYSSVLGVPVISDLADSDPGADYKLRQMEFFDGEAAEFEITRPHGQPRLYGWLMTDKFRRSIQGLETRLVGATVLTVCGGSGMDAEFLARQGAIVVASDLSVGAAQRAVERGRRAGLAIEAVVADAEHLPFADHSIDIVYVHDGLHHLSDPMVGLAEMCRVARDYVLVTEPLRAAVTDVAVRLGIALKVEDAGNRVERVSAEQVTNCLHENGLSVIGFDRYAMYYQHEPRWGMKYFSRRRTFCVARGMINGFNSILGVIGNKLAVQGVRRAPGAQD